MKSATHMVDLNWEITPEADIDRPTAKKVAQATALAKRLGPKGFERMASPLDLRKKSKPVRHPKFNPIEAAESHLKKIAPGFKFWLQEDKERLHTASIAYHNAPNDPQTLRELSDCIHTIKGNAPLLGCDAAGMIASPLSDLLEGCPDHAKAQPILALAVHAISQAIDHNPPIDDEDLLSTIAMLNDLNSQCLIKKQQNSQAD